MHLLIPALAADIDNGRRASAARLSIVTRNRTVAAGPQRPSIRRRIALGLAAVSRTSAGAVRRLDVRLADDLVTGLASSTR